MRNVLPHKKIAYGRSSCAARGLQPIHQQDVSALDGCIYWVLRDK
jgi:hypothetical protein